MHPWPQGTRIVDTTPTLEWHPSTEDIAAYLDRSLSEIDWKAVDDHLRECGACRETLDLCRGYNSANRPS